MSEQYYVGTDLKFKLDIKSGGLDVNDFDITLRCGNVEYPCVEGTDYKQDQNGDWYLLVDTTKFDNGLLQMVVYAKVEDRDFDGYGGRSTPGYRTEVAMMNLCKLKNL